MQIELRINGLASLPNVANLGFGESALHNSKDRRLATLGYRNNRCCWKSPANHRNFPDLLFHTRIWQADSHHKKSYTARSVAQAIVALHSKEG
jgi:hypothetical protein